MPPLEEDASVSNPRGASSRSRSRVSSAKSSRQALDRVFSGSHFDDQSYYYNKGEWKTAQDRPASECTQASSDPEKGISPTTASTTSKEVDETGGTREEDDGEVPLEKSQSNKSARDPNLVTWDGPEDPKNPRNWSRRRRWGATLVVSSFTFISPVSSTMVAPALASMATDFNISDKVEQQMVLAIFVLAYAVGPLFLGPLSEIYGRVPVLQLANLFFLIFNTACGASKNKVEIIIFRFLAGLGGSAPLAIGGGVLSDCWRAEERGRAVSMYSLAPLLGPAIGPIAGGFITDNTTWRWTFYAISIADALVLIFGIFFLQETYPPQLLHVKANRLRKDTGNKDLHTEFEHPERSLTKILKIALTRPFKLLGTQQIVQVLALYTAYLYGLTYIVHSTFPTLWTGRYHESIGVGGLNYISLALGYFLATQICAPLTDRIYRRLKAKNGGVGIPEFRTPLMVPGSILIPCGLFIYGWSAQYQTHWIVPNIGAAILAAGNIIEFQGIQTYIVDAYTTCKVGNLGGKIIWNGYVPAVLLMLSRPENIELDADSEIYSSCPET